ncbi:protein of unknown function [Rhodovastum atsumiense]|nr:protein of unknown function [Rhodovastum atsumiense]
MNRHECRNFPAAAVNHLEPPHTVWDGTSLYGDMTTASGLPPPLAEGGQSWNSYLRSDRLFSGTWT